MTHLKSEHFKVLRGAMILLREPSEKMFYNVFHPAGMEDLFDDRLTNLLLPANYQGKQNS